MPKRKSKALRKDFRMLTDAERKQLRRGFKILSQTKAQSNMSKYALFVLDHSFELAPESHFSSAFLPYHRELVLRYVEERKNGSQYLTMLSKLKIAQLLNHFKYCIILFYTNQSPKSEGRKLGWR